MIANIHQNQQRPLCSNGGVAALLNRMTHILEELMGEDVELWVECDFGYYAYIQGLADLRDSGYESGSSIMFPDTAVSYMPFTLYSSIRYTSTKLDHRASQRQDRSINQLEERDTDEALVDSELRLEDWLDPATKDADVS